MCILISNPQLIATFGRLKDRLSEIRTTFALNPNEMDGENVSIAYRPQDGNKSLFNNPKMSDVRFLVDGQMMYGHKQVLGLGSPVFESMFFGELKEKREVIEIQDLTLVGFQNALR